MRLVVEAKLNMNRVVAHSDEQGVRLDGLTCRDTAMPMLKASSEVCQGCSAYREQHPCNMSTFFLTRGLLQAFTVGNNVTDLNSTDGITSAHALDYPLILH